MKVAAENKKKLWFLGALGLIAAYAVYSNFLSGPSATPAPRRNDLSAINLDPGTAPTSAHSDQKAPMRPGLRAKNKDFHPVIHSKKPEEQIDIRTVDPTIRLDYLAKVQQVPPAGGERDLFQILKTPPGTALKGPETKVPLVYGPPTPPPPPPPPPDPATLPPPPIPLKYYGFFTEHTSGRKTAYFLDNDEILQAGEGATLKGRYKVVQIRATDVVVEDLQNKRQQNLKLEQEVLAG
jgi:hypothetical protein